MKRKDRTLRPGPAKSAPHTEPAPTPGSMTLPDRRPEISGTDKAPGSDPIYAKALLAEGHRLSERRQYADAEKCFRRAVQLNPYHPLARNNLGFVRQAQGDLEAAISCYRAALELDPGLRLALGNLAKALVHSGRADEALALVERWLAAGPSEPQALDAAVDVAMAAGRLELASQYALRHAVARGASRWYPQPRLHDPRTLPAQAPELTPAKLRHDIEQLQYLQRIGVLSPDFSSLITSYERILSDVAPFGEEQRFPLSRDDEAAIGSAYGRLVHIRSTPRVARALSDRWDPAALEKRYLESPPGIVFADDFLTPEALKSLRAFCLESTIWSINRYTNGYLGAFFREGFNCPLLCQIAEELQQALPRLIGRRPLLQMWGYKYDSALSGIATHADFAAVNVNFWITPDEANLDPDSGGLIVHDVEAPLNWDFQTYNDDRYTMQALLAQRKPRSINIPYRQNRVVIFNSDLFHATAPFRFRPGYENRRINITMLYGTREHAGGAAG